MKVKKLNIESYRHLQSIDFDFTYPDRHEKAGNPLDKICIIGQSATGKTSILEFVKESFLKLSLIETVEDHIYSTYQLNIKGEIEYAHNNISVRMFKDRIIQNGKEFKNLLSGGGVVQKLMEEALRLVYFSSELISKDSINIFNKNPLDILNTASDKKNRAIIALRDQNYVYEFVQNTEEDIWFSLLSKILDYRKRFTQMASELINKGAIGDFTKLNKQYTKWSETNENPLLEFSKYLDPILEKLNLGIDLINTEYPIPIKSRVSDEVIPISALSTGTKGLLLSMFPLYELDTTDSIILLDEPERSLFPDMQIDLITHYQNIAPSAQFIVATHSPFIAAAFEPEERFILYFDDIGKVRIRRGQSPIGDDPNDILRNDFNVDYYNDFGKKAYQKYVELKAKMAQESEPKKKSELLVELAELGDKYNFG